MSFDLEEIAVDPEERPRWLELAKGAKEDGSDAAGFMIHPVFGKLGQEATREADEKYGELIDKGGEVGDRAGRERDTYVASKLVDSVRNVTANGEPLDGFDSIFRALSEKKYARARGKVLIFAHQTENYRPISEAERGN